MHNVTSISTPDYLTVTEYRHKNGFVCDYSHIPRPHFCIGIVLQGRGEFYEGEKCTEVSAGEIIFVPARSEYVSKWYGKDGVKYVSFHFSFDAGPLFVPGRRFLLQKVTPAENICGYFYNALKNYGRDDPASALSLLGSFYQVLSCIFPYLTVIEEKSVSASIRKATDYLLLHYREKIYVPKLADMCHVSPSCFYRKFKEETGMSPIEYKLDLCLQKACLMLISGDMGIEEISEALGFESSTYFRRFFKKHTGMSPRKYAKAGRERQSDCSE